MNRQPILFLTLAFGISWGAAALIIAQKVQPGPMMILMMWGPGLAAIITSFWFNKSVKPLGFTLKKPSYLLAGYLLPLLYAVPVYLAIWFLGFAGFNKGFSCSWLAVFTLALQPLFAASGEEIGWRGFLYPQFSKKYGRFNAALLTGIICAVWHYPLILFNHHDGPPLWYVLSCFSLMVISMSFLMAWLRDRSGNIWPAVLLRASHSFYVVGFLDSLTSPSPYRSFVYGETGIGLAISTFVIASLLWLKHERSMVETKQMIIA